MSFENISAKNLGNLIQILFTKGLLLQLSTSVRDFELFKKFQVGPSGARSLRYAMQTSLGPARVQSRNSTTTAFPAGHEVTMSEAEAFFKEVDAVTKISYNLWKRAQQNPAKYAEPLGVEIEATMTSLKRILGIWLHGDGTGVIGTVASGTAGVAGSGVVVVDLADAGRGWAAHFERDDVLVAKAAAGSASAARINGTDVVPYWKVVSKSRKDNTVTLQALDSNLAAVSVTTLDTDFGSDEVFYRYGQQVIPNLGSISDYGTASDVVVGLESLVAADGRTLNGVAMSGVVSGTHVVGSGSLDVDMLHELLDEIKIRVGEDRYKFPQALLSKEANRFLILGAESDRRFQAMDDVRRGSKKFVFQHEQDSVELVTSEMTRKDRVWIIPEGKIEGRNVFELHMQDAEMVRKGTTDDGFMLEPNSSGYNRAVVGYMEMYLSMLCTHPAAVGRLSGFTL
jgi:hypothetical protein